MMAGSISSSIQNNISYCKEKRKKTIKYDTKVLYYFNKYNMYYFNLQIANHILIIKNKSMLSEIIIIFRPLFFNTINIHI